MYSLYFLLIIFQHILLTVKITSLIMHICELSQLTVSNFCNFIRKTVLNINYFKKVKENLKNSWNLTESFHCLMGGKISKIYCLYNVYRPKQL